MATACPANADANEAAVQARVTTILDEDIPRLERAAAAGLKAIRERRENGEPDQNWWESAHPRLQVKRAYWQALDMLKGATSDSVTDALRLRVCTQFLQYEDQFHERIRTQARLARDPTAILRAMTNHSVANYHLDHAVRELEEFEDVLPTDLAELLADLRVGLWFVQKDKPEVILPLGAMACTIPLKDILMQAAPTVQRWHSPFYMVFPEMRETCVVVGDDAGIFCASYPGGCTQPDSDKLRAAKGAAYTEVHATTADDW